MRERKEKDFGTFPPEGNKTEDKGDVSGARVPKKNSFKKKK